MRKWQHAEPRAFTQLLAGEASRDEARTIVRHLLAGCDRCQARSAAAHREVMSPETASYDAAFDRVEEHLLGEVPTPREMPAERPARRAAYAGMRR
jgi:hypothetical protein